MAKVAKKRLTSVKTGLKSMTPLHSSDEFKWHGSEEGFLSRPSVKFDNVSEIKLKLMKFAAIKARFVKPYLTLSAKTPYTAGKGYLTAVKCHSISPNDPNITFYSYPDEGIGPGTLEFWLDGLKTHEKITVEIRLSGYSYMDTGSYEVKSSIAPGLYGYFPVKGNSKIDLFFPDVLDVSGKGLITIKPVNMTGSWIFFDARLNKIT